MIEPQDHLKPAAQREAEQAKPITITWAGVDYLIPGTIEACDGDFLVAVEDGKATKAVAAALGFRQFAEFQKTRPKVRDFRGIGDLIAEAYGLVDSGN